MSARQDFMGRHFIDRGDHYDMSAPAAFLMMAHYAYAPDEEPSPDLRERTDEILARAARAGFGQTDVFITLLAKSGMSERTLRMACEVTAAVGGDAEMFRRIQITPKKGSKP